jgi:hypothetical protein
MVPVDPWRRRYTELRVRFPEICLAEIQFLTPTYGSRRKRAKCTSELILLSKGDADV